jgi:hypothetical protein
MGLSLWGTVPLVIAIVLVVGAAVFVAVVNTLQTHRPLVLPAALRTRDFLPLCLRSLEPLDRVVCVPLGAVASRFCCSCCCKAGEQTTGQKYARRDSNPKNTSTSTDAADIEVAAKGLKGKLQLADC